MALPEITALPDTIKITVTEEHIAAGVRSSRDGCPVALATWDAFGKMVTAVWVLGEQIILGRHEGAISFTIPEYVTDWLMKFDDDDIGEPIGFIAVKHNGICEMVRESFNRATHDRRSE